MKNLIAIVVLWSFCAACSHKEHHEKKAEWKELDSFHKIMADVFHPLKDSGDLKPVKKLAAQLAEEAERLASSSLPENLRSDEMKSNLEKLKTDSKSLADEIAKGASDDAIKEKLTALHDQFHKIMEASQGSHGHDENEEHEHDDEDED
ncbi:MAG: hypothetical protein HYR67_18980 [Bacteroidetes bacterium]|nr:hypothetical protein [Bacteroidota bacterium]